MPRHRTLVQFPPDLVAEIDKIVGARGRSAFLIDLAKREIKRCYLIDTNIRVHAIRQKKGRWEFLEGLVQAGGSLAC